MSIEIDADCRELLMMPPCIDDELDYAAPDAAAAADAAASARLPATGDIERVFVFAGHAAYRAAAPGRVFLRQMLMRFSSLLRALCQRVSCLIRHAAALSTPVAMLFFFCCRKAADGAIERSVRRPKYRDTRLLRCLRRDIRLCYGGADAMPRYAMVYAARKSCRFSGRR